MNIVRLSGAVNTDYAALRQVLLFCILFHLQQELFFVLFWLGYFVKKYLEEKWKAEGLLILNNVR